MLTLIKMRSRVLLLVFVNIIAHVNYPLFMRVTCACGTFYYSIPLYYLKRSILNPEDKLENFREKLDVNYYYIMIMALYCVVISYYINLACKWCLFV